MQLLEMKRFKTPQGSIQNQLFLACKYDSTLNEMHNAGFHNSYAQYEWIGLTVSLRIHGDGSITRYGISEDEREPN